MSPATPYVRWSHTATCNSLLLMALAGGGCATDARVPVSEPTNSHSVPTTLPQSTEKDVSLETSDQQSREAYLAALSKKFRSRLAHTWHQSDTGVDQASLVAASLRALEELLAQWSPLGLGGFSRSEVESILGQHGRDEPSESDGNVAAVTYWWDTGWGGGGVRIWYMGEPGNNRAMRVERLFGR